MGLFQNSVINKHLNNLDLQVVNTAYCKFKEYFLNLEIQLNIRNAKEEQFQEGFLRELFVKVLGYKLYPETNYNITTEYKNIKDSKKADGAIIINGIVKTVIELKSTNTTDLSKIEDQAFRYKNNQPECIYVITSNFEKIRFYIDNAIEHLEFNLFTITEEEFKLLYLCLSYETLSKDLPKKIKDESFNQEDVITKKLYSDYSTFKKELYQNLVTLNPQIDSLTLFKNSQKLLDRFLFIFFAEDRNLLPPNSVKLILDEWDQKSELDEHKPLYNRFKKYFEYLNIGHKGKKYDVFAYNGGLFRPDELLDNLKIDDDLLYKHTLKLSDYDFASEVDVNILGHIFENSLNELDELKAEIEGKEIDKSKTKRKKDGVFYTPKYITKYIVDNTVGKLCIDKKVELLINEEDYYKRKKRNDEATKDLIKKLTEYRDWLLQLKICDPACGSGAFLNQALDFLISEHRYIDELNAKLFGDALVLSDYDNTILENNLFGVDINEESVEIARLSLWLRTAKPNRKLNDLSNNIKCGNSLIDDPAVAGEKAFNWFLEFPQVFPHYRDKKKLEEYETSKKIVSTEIKKYPYEIDYHSLDIFEDSSYSYNSQSKGYENHGFDVVIGNPPYVSNKDMHRHGLQNQIAHWNKKFDCSKSGNYDIYILFIEQSLNLLKYKGVMSFIIPNKFLIAKYSLSLLNIINKNYFFREIVDYSNVNVFTDASVYPIIITLVNFNSESDITDRRIVEEGALEKFGFIRKWNFIKLKYEDLLYEDQDKLIEKIESAKNKINTTLSFEPGINGFQFSNYSKCVTEGKVSIDSKKLIVTGNINPYIFQDNITRYMKKDYFEPYITFNPEIISIGKWELFCKPKIMVAGMTKEIEASLDINGEYAPAVSVYSICGKADILKQIIIIINSRLINWYFKNKFSDKHLAGGYISVNNLLLQQIPFKIFANKNEACKLGEYANSLRLNYNQLSKSFLNLLLTKYEIEKPSSKLQNCFNFGFKDFSQELKKHKVVISLSEEAEWLQYFNEYKQKLLELKNQIVVNDNEIDQMVYELYELTEEEIKIVEGN